MRMEGIDRLNEEWRMENGSWLMGSKVSCSGYLEDEKDDKASIF
jgi:hypothetical protein